MAADQVGTGWSRVAVDQALSRLARKGRLRRVGRGLYDLPRTSRLLGCPAPVDLAATIAALARRDGARVMPDGLSAAHQLGLTNAVPAKPCYLTDGTSRAVTIDGRTVVFRQRLHAVGRTTLGFGIRLRWLGPELPGTVRQPRH